MTVRIPFTAAAIRRAVTGAQLAGLPVKAVSIAPDGTITVHQEAIAPPVAPGHNIAPSDFEEFVP